MAILFWTSAVLVPSLDRVAAKYWKLVNFSSYPRSLWCHCGVCTVFGHSVQYDLRLLHTDLHSVFSCSFIESFGEIFKFTAGATHEVNVIRESSVGDLPSMEIEL
ncbi:hypothetical protein DPMN_007514 [Dreissena polymorpha]|uniref:Uncharacterized protein n=1 Tax=Dreissena polymorpha TaxID=45954 RepID=A0A9D4MWN3_DREPO|nr:hypothetical protein DPMN_007514 [Dreissena polymorpha]